MRVNLPDPAGIEKRAATNGDREPSSAFDGRIVQTHPPPQRIHSGWPKVLDPRRSVTTADSMTRPCPNCRRGYKLSGTSTGATNIDHT
jgi:hypothetical protein